MCPGRSQKWTSWNPGKVIGWGGCFTSTGAILAMGSLLPRPTPGGVQQEEEQQADRQAGAGGVLREVARGAGREEADQPRIIRPGPRAAQEGQVWGGSDPPPPPARGFWECRSALAEPQPQQGLSALPRTAVLLHRAAEVGPGPPSRARSVPWPAPTKAGGGDGILIKQGYQQRDGTQGGMEMK